MNVNAYDPLDDPRWTTAAEKPKAGKQYAYIPLPWGYRALSLAGRGAGIVAHALLVQETTRRGDVPITAEVLRKCGIDAETRSRTIERLVAAGMATSRRRSNSKYQGCPLLTMLYPGWKGRSNDRAT